MPYSIGNLSLSFVIIAAFFLSIFGVTGPHYTGQTLDSTLQRVSVGYLYMYKIVRVLDGVSTVQVFHKDEFECPTYYDRFTASLATGIIGCIFLFGSFIVLVLRALRLRGLPKVAITFLSFLSFLSLLTSFSISLNVYSQRHCPFPSFSDRYFTWDWGIILSITGCALTLVVVAGSLLGR
eukprot:GILI01037567.1.p1 GENE.GILI01037567.1~~GILI01037567.1.p1  ORF type:complete len:180 (+),score=3.79 GILI01037567.1:55-594(+)